MLGPCPCPWHRNGFITQCYIKLLLWRQRHIEVYSVLPLFFKQSFSYVSAFMSLSVTYFRFSRVFLVNACGDVTFIYFLYLSFSNSLKRRL